MADDAVKDIDRGQAAILRRIAEADGLEVRVGIHSGKPRYPKHGRTQVAKVAGVHGVVKILGAELDAYASELQTQTSAAIERIKAGADPVQALLDVAMPYRDAVRARVHSELHASGLLEANIGAAVYRGRGKKWLAGDPKQGVDKVA